MCRILSSIVRFILHFQFYGVCVSLPNVVFLNIGEMNAVDSKKLLKLVRLFFHNGV